MVHFGDNQLIDRYARSTGLSLVQLNMEIARVDSAMARKEALEMKLLLGFLSLVIVFIQVLITEYTKQALHRHDHLGNSTR